MRNRMNPIMQAAAGYGQPVDRHVAVPPWQQVTGPRGNQGGGVFGGMLVPADPAPRQIPAWQPVPGPTIEKGGGILGEYVAMGEYVGMNEYVGMGAAPAPGMLQAAAGYGRPIMQAAAGYGQPVDRHVAVPPWKQVTGPRGNQGGGIFGDVVMPADPAPRPVAPWQPAPGPRNERAGVLGEYVAMGAAPAPRMLQAAAGYGKPIMQAAAGYGQPVDRHVAVPPWQQVTGPQGSQKGGIFGEYVAMGAAPQHPAGRAAPSRMLLERQIEKTGAPQGIVLAARQALPFRGSPDGIGGCGCGS